MGEGVSRPNAIAQPAQRTSIAIPPHSGLLTAGLLTAGLLTAGPHHKASPEGLARRTFKHATGWAAFRHHHHRSLPHPRRTLLHAALGRIGGPRDQGRSAEIGR